MISNKHNVKLKSVADSEFLNTVERWLQNEPEILVLIRYSRAAGSRSFEFFTSFRELQKRVRELPPETNVTVFRKPQLPLRGVVDDELIQRCLDGIQDGTEFLVVETARTTAGRASWFHDESGESHDELRQALENSRGRPVAVGEYPPWLDNTPDVISAYIPHEDGVVRPGAY